MLATIDAHFLIYTYDIQLKETKSHVLSVDLVTFACYLNQNKQGETHFAFSVNC
jgi:hypothetical protein